MDGRGLHHMRTRICVTEGLEPFPARTPLLRALDYFMYAVGFVAPLALLPQIFQIYSTKSSVGASLPTWSLLMLSSSLWFLYAVVHKDKHLLFANSLMIVFYAVIVTGLILY